jgi:hypothetical protein
MRNMVGNIFIYKSLKQWENAVTLVTSVGSWAVFLALQT